jgi:GTP-binding protein
MNTIAIVGRPNVGKSTLFNRLTESLEAIVDPTAGVTRDRKYGEATWGNKTFTIIDTGGMSTGEDDDFQESINSQVKIAVKESDAVILMVDIRDGLTDEDKAMARFLRKTGKPIILACNKVDTADKDYLSADFYQLGLGDNLFAISANNGYGTGELLDEVCKYVTEESPEISEKPRIAIVGRPNVGKSTFLNTLIGEERTIVSDISGTTRDAIDLEFNLFGKDIVLVDTAGIRKRGQIDGEIEYYSTIRSVKAIRNSDVCLLLIDASQGLTQQDLSIFREITEANKGVVILANKWDLVEKDHKTTETMAKEIRGRLASFNDVPIFFTSSVTRQRMLKALEKAVQVHENRSRRIPTSQLNDILLPLIQNSPPPVYKGKDINIKFITQLPTKSPAIAFFCNLPQYIKDPYKRFLENKLRENFDFSGIPVRLYFRKK